MLRQRRNIRLHCKNEAKHGILKEIEKEMSALVGMEEMKRNIKEIYAWIFVNQKRAEQGLKVGKQALHMMFKGNPGTGKRRLHGSSASCSLK